MLQLKLALPGILILCLLCPASGAGRGGNFCANSGAALQQYYGSVPKGLVLEGVANGIERITNISYDSAKNRFLLNRSFYFPVKIPRQELIDVLTAIALDDRLGVSFTPAGKLIIYGKITPMSEVVAALARADRMLVSIIFGWEKNLRDIALPDGWKPEGSYDRELPAISVNIFRDYTLALSGDTFHRTGMRMVNTLLPMSDRTAQDGGYVADQGQAKLSVSDENNLSFLRAHAADFLKIPQLQHAADIGEVAAFARFLRDSGNLDLKKLVKHIQETK